MAVKAIAKSVRMSPRKVGVVASLVRGRSVADADYHSGAHAAPQRFAG
ncbi:MAG: hypothetical protein U5L95_00785 [Candidatus Saccharibacteria bacterium]|nr:hypothetical protein [Candidatus Saccharibacteria bacterium]